MRGILSVNYRTDTYYADRAYTTEPWTYIELTSITASRISRQGHRLWKVTAELWVSKLDVVCVDLEVSPLKASPGVVTAAR
jgi:hypothetical protein